MSVEDRQEALRELIATFQQWLYLPDPGIVEIILGAYAANRLNGDPVWLLVVGGPGSGKTEIVEAISQLAKVIGAGTLTEASLLSGTSTRDWEDGAGGGLLRQIDETGILSLKDFTSILSINRDKLSTLMAALREIYDGKWTRLVGTDGGKVLNWVGKVGIIGGVTNAIDTHHVMMNSLGARFLFYRLPKANREKQASIALGNQGRQVEMREKLSNAVWLFFSDYCYDAIIAANKEGVSKLDESDIKWLSDLASLVAICRSSVERDGRTREVEHICDPEMPGRLIQTLGQLRAGLNIIGVPPERQRELVRKVGLDCIPPTRRIIIDRLVEGQTSEGEILKLSKLSRSTVRRSLEDLDCHGVVEKNGQSVRSWRFSDDWTEAVRTLFPERAM